MGMFISFSFYFFFGRGRDVVGPKQAFIWDVEKFRRLAVILALARELKKKVNFSSYKYIMHTQGVATTLIRKNTICMMKISDRVHILLRWRSCYYVSPQQFS